MSPRIYISLTRIIFLESQIEKELDQLRLNLQLIGEYKKKELKLMIYSNLRVMLRVHKAGQAVSLDLDAINQRLILHWVKSYHL